jgi:hypothetical protein
MNSNDIQQFFNTLKDFLQHAETELDAYEKRQEACKYSEEIWDKEIEYLAAKYEVTADYIIEEFMI